MKRATRRKEPDRRTRRALVTIAILLVVIAIGVAGSYVWGVTVPPDLSGSYSTLRGGMNAAFADFQAALWSSDPSVLRNPFWLWYGRLAEIFVGVVFLGIVVLEVIDARRRRAKS